MLKLTTRQRELLAEKLADVANVAAGALVFGQVVSERPFSVVVAVLGISAWAAAMVLALVFSKDTRHAAP